MRAKTMRATAALTALLLLGGGLGLATVASAAWNLFGITAVRDEHEAARVVSLPVLDPGPVDLPTRKGARARYGLSDEFVIGAFADHADEHRDDDDLEHEQLPREARAGFRVGAAGPPWENTHAP